MSKEDHKKLIDDIFKEYLPDIHSLAEAKSKKYPDRIPNAEDLYEAGLHGLMIALRDYDKKQSNFRTYAWSKIDGIMQDHCTGNRSFGKQGVIDPAVEAASRVSANRQKRAEAAQQPKQQSTGELPPPLPQAADTPPPLPEANADVPPPLPADDTPPPIPGQSRRP